MVSERKNVGVIMRLILFLLIFSAINAANAQIYCKGKPLNIAQIINQNIDVLNELYNGENFRVYDGAVCGVEDTLQICFYGEDLLAAKQLTEYFQYAYQYDDGINCKSCDLI